MNIRERLSQMREAREASYISLPDFFTFLSKTNNGLCLSEIAQFLLIELKQYNPENAEEIWGWEEWKCWVENNGVVLYEDVFILEREPKFSHQDFFSILRKVLNGDEFDHLSIITEYAELYLNRDQIESILNIKIPTSIDESKVKNDIREQVIDLSMLFSRTEEFVKNTDINKSPIGLAERIAYEKKISDLLKKIDDLSKPDTQAVEYTTIEDNTEKGNRISSPQRAIFSLLVMKCYPNHSTRNELFNAINVELKSNGITTKDLKYPTLDRLIDEDLRINNLSPFPPKIK